jgi:RND family efflux transporter MFP subunit
MKRIAWRLALLTCGVAVVGCKQNHSQEPSAAPLTLDVSKPVAGAISNYEVFTGRTQALNYADIRARVNGYLKEANFKEGEDVKEGKVLFVIDPRPYDAALNQAKANLALQQAVLNYADRDYNRNVELIKTKSVSQDDFEKSLSAFETAKASVDAGRAAVKTAQLNVDFTQVTAPFSGRISRRQVDPGTDIQADVTVMASLVQTDELYAYFDVNERVLLQIRDLLQDGKVPPDAAEKFPVKLGFANEKPEDFSHEGTLKFADNRVDPATGTLRMWGVFKNPKHDLYSGLFIRVRMTLPMSEEDAKKWLFVSEEALGTEQERKYLYVVKKVTADDGKPMLVTDRIYVEVGQRQDRVAGKEGTLIAVKGLKGDELVVVGNWQRLRPKMEVKATNLGEMPRKMTAANPPPVNGLQGPR